MKAILEKIFGKEIKSLWFNQNIDVYPRQYKDGEIYETDVISREPTYSIIFIDGSETVIELSELIVTIFNSK